MEAKYSKFLTILLVVIIIAIVGLIGYLGFSYYKNYSSKSDADKFVSSFVEEANQTEIKPTENNTDEGISNEILTANTGSTSSSKEVPMYKGYEILGTIEIPKTNVNYPVYKPPISTAHLELSVGVLCPLNKQLNTEGNIVIIGHNFRNGTFFSDNKKLANGDKIYITDLDGNKVTYEIYNTFVTSKDDIEFYNRDTEGAKEITLSTCADDDTDQRVIVEAKAVE